MKFDHKVKYKGKWYMPGEEITNSEKVGEVTASPITNEYTKTAINRMSTAELQALATEQGIAGASKINGAELKKLLIDKFNL